MQSFNHFESGFIRLCLCFTIVFLFMHTGAYGSSCDDYEATPPFLTTQIKPNVLFMLDNSGSMKQPLNNTGWGEDCSSSAGTGFSPGTTYFGMFDSTAFYEYDKTVPVDDSPYDGDTDSPYDVTDGSGNTRIDTSATGAFVQAVCTPAPGVNCWSGNFLNWLTTRKIDAARKVLVGGKVENRQGFDYLGDGSTTWKIVGNNERDDRSICKASGVGQTYSPFPDDTRFHLYSPADQGSVKAQYDPYAKLLPIFSGSSSANVIKDKNDVIVGEFGQVTSLTHNEQTITFVNSYTNPVIIAKPLTRNGSQPAFIRINYDAATSTTSFTIRVQEWEYLDGSHIEEAVSYFVFEKGSHTFSGPSGDITLVAGGVDVNVEVNNWQTVSGLGLSTTPVVVGSVVSGNDGTAVVTRLKSVTSNQFDIALQEEESRSGHAKETVHYIAVEPGLFTSGELEFSAGIQTGFDESWKALSFNSINGSGFVADMQTTNGTDPASLRYQNLTSTGVQIMVEEEESSDSEISHTDEDIGYLAVDAPALGFNVALVVADEPQGLVHEIEDKVRTGISFYRYQRDNDIYTGEWAHGGTMHLAIPANPFVKSNSDIASYRYLDTPIKSATEDIVDAIEHYPLVWGTTPLAENLYEVGRYFSQESPYYDDKPVINSESAYQVNDDWDPFTYLIEGSYQKVRCAKSFVIIFTDGEPWRDDYVPAAIVGNTGGGGDYDGDNNARDCSNTAATTNNCVDNLDDVARYLYWDNLLATNRDLRTTDLDGEQHLEIFTVAFGSSTIPQILQDTADNANGEAYAAEDGEKLREALTSAITSILKRTSAGSSLSVLSERATTGALINQALFFPQKTFTDGGDTFDVSWIGSLNAYWFYNSRTVSNIRENTVDSLGYYALDIHDDKVLDFRIDSQGALKIDYYKTIQDGSDDDGAADPNSGPGGTAGPEGTYQSIDDVNMIFEAGEILKDRVVDADPNLITDAGRRYIYGVNESDTMSEFVQANTSAFDDLLNLIPSDLPACLGTANNTTEKTAAARNLISYIRGAGDDFSAQANIAEACRSRIVDKAGKIWKLGDIIYSTPTVLDYVGSGNKYSFLFTGANDGMIHAFKIGKLRKDAAGTGQAIALCDSNVGTCTHTEIGDEAWTFIPRNAMPYLKYLADPDYQHIYTVDLPPYIFEAGNKRILIGGMRFGGATGCTYTQGGTRYWCGDTDRDGVIDLDSDGTPIQAVPPESTPGTITNSTLGLSSYFALDVTDPYNPQFLWEFSDAEMGYSYSGPAVIKRRIGGIIQTYVMFVSGPLSNKGGTAPKQDLKIYVLKLDSATYTIDSVFRFDGNGEAGFTKESALANLDAAFGGRLFTEGIDFDTDGSTDAVFFGVNWLASNDWKGNVFMVAPTDDEPVTFSGGKEIINWEIGKVFNSGQAPITAKVEHGLCYNNNYIYFGSGRWFYKLDTPGQNVNDTNSLWGVEIDDCLDALSDGDDTTKCTSTLNRAHNGKIDDDLCHADGSLNTNNEISWQLKDMAPYTGGEDYFMERTITDPTFSSDIAIFTTMQPSSDMCDFGGRTRVWSFNCRTGHSVWDGCSGATSTPPPGALLLQLSGGNIEDTVLNKTNFNAKDNRVTGWFTGVPPESSTPFVPYSGKLTGEIILWIER